MKKKILVIVSDQGAIHRAHVLLDETFVETNSQICHSIEEALEHIKKSQIDFIIYVLDHGNPKTDECLIIKELTSQERLIPIFFYYVDFH